jgi:hypothetical protein
MTGDSAVKLLRAGSKLSIQTSSRKEGLEDNAAKHGRQRRMLGFPIVWLLRELQIFRSGLTDMVHEVVGTDPHAEEVQQINDPAR